MLGYQSSNYSTNSRQSHEGLFGIFVVFSRNCQPGSKIHVEMLKVSRKIKPVGKRTKLESWHSLISWLLIRPMWSGVCYWHKDRQIGQWNSTESQNNPYIYRQPILDKGAKVVHLWMWLKDSLLKRKCWNNIQTKPLAPFCIRYPPPKYI